MEFISKEQFLEQSKEVQKVFLDWFNDNISDYDLVQDENRIMLYKDFVKRECIENDSYPLLVEGQLRKFIEDKRNAKIDISYYRFSIEFELYHQQSRKGRYKTEIIDLLQAYWQVAQEIAKESVTIG